MGLFDNDDDRFFDFNGDGELDAYEKYEQMDFYTSPCENEYDEDEEELEDALALNGLSIYDLEDMDEDERIEALEDAGLDPDDYDF